MQAFVPITNAPVTLNTGDELKFRCKFDTTKENSEVSVCLATLRKYFNFKKERNYFAAATGIGRIQGIR
jgi:hypothetical protein